MKSNFILKSKFKPAGGQPKAIEEITKGFKKGLKKQTLLGITGSGKTFVMANIIKNINKQTLVLAHNKTLAAQLYQELKSFFPENRVEYFISYYDYYQPESYLPTTDTYIEKEATINEEIERMRLRTLASLMSRKDTIVVASISCIYGAGDPDDFGKLSLIFSKGNEIGREEIIKTLTEMQYRRSTNSLNEGEFRFIGETLEIYPSYYKEVIRIEFFGEEIEKIKILDNVSFVSKKEIDTIRIFPTKQFAVTTEKMERAIKSIKKELNERLEELDGIEKERLKKKVNYDIEMIEEMGYCSGIENYSRHFENRKPGTPPKVLLDYFEEDFLMIIDESHQTIPQSRAMYKGDYSRKENLVEFGFRLPSAFDNRPLKFDEFEKYFKKTLFVSATPGDYEIENSQNITELIIRPTGLLDPEVIIRKCQGQVNDLYDEIIKTIKQGWRVLITTLTKKMAEELTEYYSKKGLKVRYLHSDIKSLERIELIRDLRAGEFDVLIGINLLREGLDIPEVALVAILDADKEGFLRNERSLIQTIGRAARNSESKVILYADRITKSIKIAVDKTKFRRNKQIEYNKKHGIVPKTIIKKVEEKNKKIKTNLKSKSKFEIRNELIKLEAEMKEYAEKLDFEKAIQIRDRMEEYKKFLNQ